MRDIKVINKEIKELRAGKTGPNKKSFCSTCEKCKGQDCEKVEPYRCVICDFDYSEAWKSAILPLLAEQKAVNKANKAARAAKTPNQQLQTKPVKIELGNVLFGEKGPTTATYNRQVRAFENYYKQTKPTTKR